MLVYRIVPTNFAKDMSGEGARLFGGRWNHAGTPCIYTSANRALAILEYSANVPLQQMPTNLQMVCFDIKLKEVPVLTEAQYPKGWNSIPAKAGTKDYGTAWLQKRSTLALQVPSVIVPEEYNVLINPLHADMRLLSIKSMQPFSLDARVKK